MNYITSYTWYEVNRILHLHNTHKLTNLPTYTVQDVYDTRTLHITNTHRENIIYTAKTHMKHNLFIRSKLQKQHHREA